jgi:predicted ATPase
MEFSAAAVAAGVDRAVEDVEAQYDALARRGQVVSQRGTEAWVDGTVAGRYGFLHDLHREFVYDRVPVSRRVRWHRTIGRRLEQGYGPQAREIAAKLAEHFVRGRDAERAVQYLYYAGEQAVQRSAHLEAIGHLTTGLKLLITLPETPERAQQELLLQTTLGAALMATKGYAAPEVEHAYARARELCQQVGETPELFRVLLGLHMFYRQRAELQTSYEVGKQLLTLAESVQTPEFLLVAHQALGTTWYFLGGVRPRQDPSGARHGAVRLPTAPSLCHPLRPGPRRHLPLHAGPGAVGTWLSRPGAAEKPRGVNFGAAASASL